MEPKETPATVSRGTQTELSIRNESVQRIYNFYRNQILFVNRRYQRKLIWTLDEKQGFIDSLIQGFPVPLILLAEATIAGENSFEIIDGMQRLNAICSFVEGEFPYNGNYFDLETMVESKSAKDSGEVAQKQPILDRKICEVLSSYVLPISIYSLYDPKRVDEIFIRINSYGKHLSKQELRAAGTLENFGDLVRTISSEIRTDVSHGNILNLNKMKEISITNVGLDYGINVNDVFWVSNNIITKEMVRNSRDEEIVADLLASISFADIPATSSTILDEYYGLKRTSLSEELDYSLQKQGIDNLREQFLKIYNEIRNIISLSDGNFKDLVGQGTARIIPRYFQIVFLALHKLICKDNKQVSSYPNLIKKMKGIGTMINITEGGNWSSANRNTNVDAVVGIFQDTFKDNTSDPAKHKWLTEFETILMQSKTEQTSYDFKQGFTTLDGNNKFDQESFNKIILTLTAIANNSGNAAGYVCVGISDDKKDANRVKDIYGVEAKKYRNFHVIGIGHEAVIISKNVDTFFRFITQKIKEQPISEETKDMLAKNIRLINYFDKDVIIFRTMSLATPQIYDKKYYVRHGANVNEVQPEKYASFFSNYKKS